MTESVVVEIGIKRICSISWPLDLLIVSILKSLRDIERDRDLSLCSWFRARCLSEALLCLAEVALKPMMVN